MLNSHFPYSEHDLIPKMTSNTCEVGEVISSNLTSESYMAFDKNYNSREKISIYNGNANNYVGVYIGFHFNKKYLLNTVIFPYVNYSTNGAVGTFVLQASNDGENWTDISEPFQRSHEILNYEEIKISKNKKWYSYYRAIMTEANKNIYNVMPYQFCLFGIESASDQFILQ